MKKSTQYGKGLAGFFFGLILATGIIAGILFFLNQGNQNVFKELTQPKQSEEPEILKPQDKAEKRPATDNSSSQADEEKAKAEKEAAEKEAKAKEAAEKAAKEAEKQNTASTSNNTSSGSSTTRDTGTKTSSGNFFLIAGAFSSEANARNRIKQLKRDGYSSATMVGQNEKGYYLVAYKSFSSRSQAESYMPEIKGKGLSTWVYPPAK